MRYTDNSLPVPGSCTVSSALQCPHERVHLRNMALWNSKPLARLCMMAIFIVSALSQLQEFDQVRQQVFYHIDAIGIKSRGIPPMLLAAAIAMQCIGVVAVCFGFDRFGAAVLLAFLVPTTAVMHNPIVLGKVDNSRMTHLLKNIAIAGGLMLLGADRNQRSCDTQKPSRMIQSHRNLKPL